MPYDDKWKAWDHTKESPYSSNFTEDEIEHFINKIK